MDERRVLRDCAERMGVWLTEHPSGALILRAEGETATLIPSEDGWILQLRNIDRPGIYHKEHITRLDRLVHEIQGWAWGIGVRWNV